MDKSGFMDSSHVACKCVLSGIGFDRQSSAAASALLFRVVLLIFFYSDSTFLSGLKIRVASGTL